MSFVSKFVLSSVQVIFICSVTSRGEAPECLGISCKNGGNLTMDCTCQCTPEFSGGDCSQERKISAWPKGSYGLLSSVYGCPETPDYGWHLGFINLTFTGSKLSYQDWSDSLHLLGPYHLWTVQLNFCMRKSEIKEHEISTDHNGTNSVPWPPGEYCIFKADACPTGFEESNLTLRNYTVSDGAVEGSLPDITWHNDSLMIGLCCRRDGESNTTISLPHTFPFYFVRTNSNTSCQAVESTEVWNEEFVFIKPTVTSLNQEEEDGILYLCFYQPFERRECAFHDDLGSSYKGRAHVSDLGFECDPWEDNSWPANDDLYILGNLEKNYCRKGAANWRYVNCKHGAELFSCKRVPLCNMDSDFPVVDVSVTARSSPTKQGLASLNAVDGDITMECDWYLHYVKACFTNSKNSPSFITESGVTEPWIQVDLQRSFLVQAVIVIRAEDEKPYNARYMMSFVSHQRWDFLTHGAPVCEGPTHLGQNTVYRFECVRLVTGRFVTLQNNVATHPLRDQNADVLFELSEIKIKAKAIRCGNPLGMLSGEIQDFQITSSSSVSRTFSAAHARLHKATGWCPETSDQSPFLQVDLLASTTVEGVDVEGWVADHAEGNATFTLQYGVSLRNLRSYMDGRHQPRIFHLETSHSPHFLQRFMFAESVFTRYLKLVLAYPTCLKFEILGCKKKEILDFYCNDRSHLIGLHTNQRDDMMTLDQVSSVNDTTLRKCLKQCLQVEDCQYFTYNQAEETCEQKAVSSLEESSISKDDTNVTMYQPICIQEPEKLEDCRQVVTDEGEITSPGFPHYYGEGLECVWNIEFPNGNQVKIDIIRLSLPDKDPLSKKVGSYETLSADCEDTLSIADGNKTLISAAGAKAKGYQGSKIISATNQITLTLRTCMRISRAPLFSGFRIKVSNYECDQGFQSFDGHCYLFGHEGSGLTWLQAQEKCQDLGSHLVSINSAEEMRYLHAVMVLSDNTFSPETYIGLTKRNAREFVWTNGDTLTFTDWHSDPETHVSQPDGGDGELCTMVRLSDVRSTSTWHDVVCAFDRVHQYICEKSQPTTKVPEVLEREITLDTIPPSIGYYYQCANGDYITRVRWCDGNSDCTDGSDELLCEFPCSSRFTCDNGRCISVGFVCDYKDDCGDNSDEKECVNRPCATDEWTCSRGQCVRSSSRCDLNKDCIDGTDEEECDICLPPAFRCYDGTCIHESNVCDGQIDCGGVYNEDEGTDCKLYAHPSCGAWYSLGARETGAYMISSQDGDSFPVECVFNETSGTIFTAIHHDQEDELIFEGSTTTLHYPLTYSISRGHINYILSTTTSCRQLVTFSCQGLTALMSYYVSWVDSQGDVNRFYNESKSGCQCDLEHACQTGLSTCACEVQVISFWYQVPDRSYMHDRGYITDKDRLPIASIDFKDFYYQMRASFSVGPLECEEEMKSTTELMMCKSGVTAPSSSRCVLDSSQHGRIIGCRDRTHLLDCAEFKCPANHLKCPGSYCVSLYRVCDGQRDCLDGTDELRCETFACPGAFRCGSAGKCLVWDKVCDGVAHCPDGDDEFECTVTCPERCNCTEMATVCREISTDAVLMISKNTKLLDLSRTFLEGFINYTFEGLSQLLFLNLSSSGITEVSNTSFVGLANLLTLDLSANLIDKISDGVFSGLFNLKRLILTGNTLLRDIMAGSFQDLHHLPELDLSGLNIRTIQQSSFLGLENLQTLNLSGNKLKEIESGAFTGLSTLVTLDMRRNDIAVFDGEVFFGLSSLKYLLTDAYEFCCVRPVVVEAQNCFPQPDEFSSCSDLMKNISLRVCLWVLGVFALCGNLAVIMYRLIFDRTGLKQNNGILVANLGISDFLMGVYMLIIAGTDLYFRGRYNWNDSWWRRSELCQFAGFLSTLSSEVSAILLCMITIDRLLALKAPFSKAAKSPKLAMTICCVVWVSGLALAGVPLLPVEYFQGRFYSRSGVCLALPLTRDRPAGWEYAASVFVVFNFLCFVIIAVGQAAIYRDIRNQESMRLHKGDIQLARRLSIIVMTDFLCWFPICVMGLMAMTGHVIPGDVYAWVAAFILPINSALNPILYTLSSLGSTQLKKRIVKRILGGSGRGGISTTNGSTAISRGHAAVKYGKSGQKRNEILSLKMALESGLTVPDVQKIARSVSRSLKVMHDHELTCSDLSEENVILCFENGMMSQAFVGDSLVDAQEDTDSTNDILKLGNLIQTMLDSASGAKT